MSDLKPYLQNKEIPLRNADTGRIGEDYGFSIGGQLRPAKVYRSSGSIRCTYTKDSAYIDPKGMIDFFIDIKADRDVVAYVETYGPLGLCEHGYPYWCRHPKCAPTIGEPISRYHDFSQVYKGALIIASALMRNDVAPMCAWNLLLEPINNNQDWDEYSYWESNEILARIGCFSKNLNESIREYEKAINLLSKMITPKIGFSWRDSTSDPTVFIYRNGFSTLHMQLLGAITRSADPIYICSGCGKIYLRKVRGPKPGQRNYCAICEASPIPDKLRQRDKAKRDGQTPTP